MAYTKKSMKKSYPMGGKKTSYHNKGGKKADAGYPKSAKMDDYGKKKMAGKYSYKKKM